MCAEISFTSSRPGSAKNHAEILVEDLHVKAMVQNRHLARAIHDVGWSEIGGNWSISRFCTDRW